MHKRMKSTQILVSVIHMLFASSSMACSGDGAGEEMGFNSDFSWFTVGLICGVSFLVVLSRIKRKASSYITGAYIASLVVVLVVHPIRVIGVYSGDCGMVTYRLSLFIAVLYVLFALYESIKLFKSKGVNA